MMTSSINRARTAAFDVDAQNGFTPVCPDELPVPGGDHIIASSAELAAAAA
jgi:nicotinamidase/pyrazinamidase